jgi:hypothetical protein
MRISKGIVAAALITWAGLAYAQQAIAPTAPSAPGPYAPGQEALERGLGAYRVGKHDAALTALSSAAAQGDSSIRFMAEFYLARIYAMEAGPATDHTRAFVLYRKLADENLDADPLTSQRAPFVAKALLALAGYVRAGVKAIDLPPNPRRAADYLHHAAVFFGDRDAQLELAKAYLSADSGKDDVRRGLHYLAVLAEESHGPAQAVLADLFWRGRHVAKDDRRALALVTMAVENAPSHERIWIEESYAAIFCGTNQIVRAEAGVLVAGWRQTFVRPDGTAARTGAFEFLPARQCASGEQVALGASGRPKVEVVVGTTAPEATAKGVSAATAGAPIATGTAAKATVGASSGAGFKLKAAGIVEAAATKK